MHIDAIDVTAPMLWTIDAVLTPAECEEQIARIERIGPELATINTGRPGGEIRRGLRNNGRITVDDQPLAQLLWSRVARHIPTIFGRAPTSVNERLRGYRYQPGEYFGLHYDGRFARAGECSELTFMIYLNAGFIGGETSFPELNKTIRPQAGTALLFQHMLLHEGCAVQRGVKYAIRSDIMFQRQTSQVIAP